MAIILDWGKRKNFTLDPKVMPYQNHSKSRVGRLSQIHIIQTNRYFTVFSYGSVWKYCIPIIPMDYQHFPSQNGYLGFWPRHILTPMVTTGDPPWLSTQWLKDYWWNRHIIYHNRYVCYVLCKYCTLLSHTYIYINIQPSIIRIHTISTYYQKHYWLVVSTPLKNMKGSWGYYSQYMEK